MRLGFYCSLDLKTCNVNDSHLESIPVDRVPDVVLVKKVFGDKSLRNRKRKWRLKHMDGLHENDTASQNDEYEAFLEDLEEDPELRQNVNVYRDQRKMAAARDGTESESGDDFPQISLAEMLDELALGDASGGEEEEAEMAQ